MILRKIAGNSAINLFYQLIAVLIALVFVPIGIHILGVELFGVYSLSITFLVLFNYFNFGIAPLTTKELSIRIHKIDYSNINSIVFNSFIIMIFIGFTFLFFFISFSDYVSSLFFKDSVLLQKRLQDFLCSVGILSPLVFTILIQRAILESIQLFKVTSFVKMILNSTIFVAPSFLYNDYFNINDIYKIIIFFYIISIIYQFFYIFKEFIFKYPIRIYFLDFKKLLNIGFYVMLSALLMALLTYFDRYYIAYHLPASDVSYYTISFDAISRLNIIIWCLISALFPMLSAWYENNEIDSIRKYLKIGLKISFFILIFISSFLVLFGYEILEIWVGGNYANEGGLVFKLLSFGVIFNAASIILSRALIAFGREKVLVCILFGEFVFYFFVLLFLVDKYYLIGVSIAYIVKSLVQYILLIIFANRAGLNFILNFRNKSIKNFIVIFIMLISIIILALRYLNPEYKIIFFLLYSGFYVYLWRKYILKKEAILLISLIRNKVLR